jgi:hypothetical protein
MITIDKFLNLVEIKDLEDSIYNDYLRNNNLTGIRINDAYRAPQTLDNKNSFYNKIFDCNIHIGTYRVGAPITGIGI